MEINKTETNKTEALHGDNLSRTRKIKSVIAASSGNLVEWFDFYIYAFATVYFAHSFSSSDSAIVQQIQVFGIFALGFLMRPLGSWIFGSLADKIGRKNSMVASVVLMAIGSFMIAFAPTVDSVGDFAVVFLLLARLIQGLSVGGEYGVAATYLSELATKGRRSFYSSFQYTTLVGGQLLAVAGISIMLLIFTEKEMYDYAWRILFFMGGVFALGSLLIRKSMIESSEKLDKHQDRGTIGALFKSSMKPFLIVIIVSSSGSLVFYTATIYSKQFLIGSANMTASSSNNLMLIALFVLMIVQPIFGLISDKIGIKNSSIIFTLLALVGIYPIFDALRNSTSFGMSLSLIIVLFLILSFYTSIAGILKARLFPEHVRALGTGFSYAIGNSIFGGTAPWVALQFKSHGVENYFFVYVAIMLFLMFIMCCLLPKKGLLN